MQETLRAPARPWASDGDRIGRDPTAKRRAYASVAARYDRAVPRAWRLALLAGVVIVFGAVGYGLATGDELAPFEPNRTAYDDLAERTLSLCERPECAYGWGESPQPPDGLRDAMAKVRARHVVYYAAEGEVHVSPGYRHSATLVYRTEATGRQAEWRARQARAEAEAAAVYGWPAAKREDLGSGWARISRPPR